MNVSNQASRDGRIRICDSSFNKIENMGDIEFSDDEDIPEKPTNSQRSVSSILKSFFKPFNSN